MRHAWIIAWREFRSYFISPLAYAVAASLYLILGGIFFINLYFGLQSGGITPDGRMVMGPLVTILVLFITPLLTMRLIADEGRMGTLELLLTSPIRDWELILGKWLGAMMFVLALLAVTWIYPIVLNQLADPGIDQGVLLSAYLGVTLLAASILAVGVLISAMFDSPIVAAAATFGVLLVLWILGGLGTGSGALSQWASYLGLVDHFYDNLYRGVVNLSDVVYYLSLTLFSLFLGSQVVQARRWR